MKTKHCKFVVLTIIIFLVISRFAAALEQMELIEQMEQQGLLEQMGLTEQQAHKDMDEVPVEDAGTRTHLRLRRILTASLQM